MKVNRKDVRRFVSYIVPRPGPLAYCLFAVQAVYFLLFITGGVHGYSFSISGVASILFSFISLLIVASVLENLLLHRAVAFVLFPVSVISLWSMSTYHLTSGSPLDYSLVRDNIGISFSPESFRVIGTAFSFRDYALLVFFIAALYTCYRFFYRDRENIWKNTAGARVTAVVLWVVVIAMPVSAADEFTMFMKSILAYNSGPPADAVPEGYPYFRKRIPGSSFRSSVPSGKVRPNVFLIMVESFNANFVESVAPDGKEYTPYFDSLIKKGLYFERFYGNSIQTCKGQEAVFFSIIPAYKGKLFVDYPDVKISGFPAILADNGYETVFFQAYHDLKFDNTYNSMVKAGFRVVKSFAEFRRNGDSSHIWGWGVEDATFYERFFEILDSMHAASTGKPVFAALATVGTHIPCDGMPVEKRTIYREPANIREKYSNALRLSDSQLPVFFRCLGERGYLDNSIVIITGDHSFPMKEHGIYNNEKCFYDEAFRIPFLIIWDGVINPERVKGRAFSQVDIGPTIADMLGIREADNTMTGASVFAQPQGRDVFLVQPYNGRYLEVVNYPYKYIFHMQTGTEYLFDLAADPGERVNLVGSGKNENVTEGLRKSLEHIYLNQQLIDRNSIRP